MRKWLKRIGIGLGGLVGLLVIAAGALYAVGRSKLQRTYPLPAVAVARAAADPAKGERGRLVMQMHGCQECHGADLSGKVFLDIPPGVIVAPNLTRGRGGVGARYTDADWDRAVRHGLRPDGRIILPFMPYRLYNRLSDGDAAALVAYLKSLPPVDHEVPPSTVRLPGYVMVATMGDLRDGMDTTRTRSAPEPGPTAAYGAYLSATVCVECHGERLEGGEHPAPGAPPGPGLAHAAAWRFEDFAAAVRNGVAPGGRRLAEWMPSRYFREMSDVELRAIHAYLATLPSGLRTAPADEN